MGSTVCACIQILTCVLVLPELASFPCRPSHLKFWSLAVCTNGLQAIKSWRWRRPRLKQNCTWCFEVQSSQMCHFCMILGEWPIWWIMFWGTFWADGHRERGEGIVIGVGASLAGPVLAGPLFRRFNKIHYKLRARFMYAYITAGPLQKSFLHP